MSYKRKIVVVSADRPEDDEYSPSLRLVSIIVAFAVGIAVGVFFVFYL